MKHYHCIFSSGTEKAGYHGQTLVSLHTWCFYDMASSDVSKVRWGAALSTSLIILTFLRPLLKWHHHREESSVKALELNNNPIRYTRTSFPSLLLFPPYTIIIRYTIHYFLIYLLYWHLVSVLWGDKVFCFFRFCLFVCFCSRFPVWLGKDAKSKDVFIFAKF